MLAGTTGIATCQNQNIAAAVEASQVSPIATIAELSREKRSRKTENSQGAKAISHGPPTANNHKPAPMHSHRNRSRSGPGRTISICRVASDAMGFPDRAMSPPYRHLDEAVYFWNKAPDRSIVT
ncbi:hypothetical protein GCM10011529_18850 [Polymorphobacter glacialis]|uniref:Uncharacterized protein n=1 Tax=Sandarakinorhabdus glacialis TaxID=1614636 RepID=A0A917E858_9SPHN|nr:hypothetical protein GCM10011529_18850 [Polymorphobacter glacialis]